jgi:bacteriorhodopsin
LNVGALVTLIAAVHYFYMREYWVQLQASPIVYRYIDWSLTVPLQMMEFVLILQAVKPDLGSGMFFRLLIGTVVMRLFGYMGEALIINLWVGFGVGLCGWAFILAEIFVGPASSAAKDNLSPAVSYSFNLMRFIMSIGWSIYPLGYYLSSSWMFRPYAGEA